MQLGNMKKIDKIKATFNIELKNHIMVMWPEASEILFKLSIDDSEIFITLVRCFSNKFRDEGDEYYTEPIFQVKIEVIRKGIFKIPDAEVRNKTIKDYKKKIEYFDKLLPKFSNHAYEAYTRLIYFLKYYLYNPYLIEYPREHAFFHNAKWTDIDGNKLGGGTNKMLLTDTYELEMKFGKNLPLLKLSPKFTEELKFALNNPIQPQLHSQMLSGAITSLFDFNIHRAVIELAIACEILVKRSFFPKESPGGIAFDYFEDKSKIKITVPELIDKIAKEAFDKSFATDQPKNYKNIQNLFRCRNKVVHRGSIEYRDIYTDKMKIADIKTVVIWAYSVRYLEIWFLKCKL